MRGLVVIQSSRVAIGSLIGRPQGGGYVGFERFDTPRDGPDDAPQSPSGRPVV